MKHEWKCYLFGATDTSGIVWALHPGEKPPNAFVRWMMRVVFSCRWERTEP